MTGTFWWWLSLHQVSLAEYPLQRRAQVNSALQLRSLQVEFIRPDAS
jgi:hypothetical protein